MKTAIIGTALLSAHTKGLVSSVIPGSVYTKGLFAAGTCPTNSSHFEEQVAGTYSKNSNQFEFVGLVAGTKVGSLRLNFKAKMASWRNGPGLVPTTCYRDQSPHVRHTRDRRKGRKGGLPTFTAFEWLFCISVTSSTQIFKTNGYFFEKEKWAVFFWSMNCEYLTGFWSE